MLNRRWMMRMAEKAEEIPPYGGRFVKSLNSDGSSWIVTDFYPDSETVFTFRFNDTAWDVAYENYYGAAGYKFRMQRNSSSSNAYVIDMYGYGKSSIAWSPSGDHTVIADCPNAKFTLDTETYTGTPVSEYKKLEYPLLLFALGKSTSNPTTGDKPGKLKLYEARVEQNGVLTHKWRPAIDADGIACLYDTVTQKCLYNAGTGTFTFDE